MVTVIVNKSANFELSPLGHLQKNKKKRINHCRGLRSSKCLHDCLPEQTTFCATKINRTCHEEF